MKRRCAWCGVIYGHSEPLHVGITTHGACDVCHTRIVQNFERLEGEAPKPAPAAPTAATVELWVTPSNPPDHS
jgi:hypothetical protein